MQQLDKCEENILDYFSSKILKPLDRTDIEGSGDYNRKYYTGVRIPYIYKYIIKEEISYDDFITLLLKLKEEEKISSLYCGTVSDIVIESIYLQAHWNYNYKSFVKKIENNKDEWRKQIQQG